MSVFLATADALAAHLATVPGLAELPIVVDRQKDLENELRRAIAKAGGLAVITWTGAKNEDASADGPRFASTYTVTLFAKPILRRDETPADDLVEQLAQALHDYRPTANFHDRLVVSAIDPVPAEELLIYRITVTTPSQF